MSELWWRDGAMVIAAESDLDDDQHFVGDAATEDDAQRIVDWHNATLAAADPQPDSQPPPEAIEVRRILAKDGRMLLVVGPFDGPLAADRTPPLDVERLARAICDVKEPPPIEGVVFVDDECRTQARKVAARYAALGGSSDD